MRAFEFHDVRSLLNEALSLDYFLGDDPAIPYHRVDGHSKLLVVVGDNASGKSFFRRVVQAICQKTSTECMPISVEGRRKIGYMPWLAFVYGDEEREATGVNSTNTILVGIKTSEDRSTPHVIFLDEPDLGLSEDWAAGAGQKLCEFAKSATEHLRAAIIVSHSRALVRELLPAEPFYLHLGVESSMAPQTLQDWVDRPIVPRDPTKLPEMSRERFRKIQACLDRVKP